MSILKNRKISFILLFASFVYIQFVTLRLGNRAGWGLLSEPHQEFVYFFLQIFVIGGYLLYAFLISKVKNPRIQNGIKSVVLVLSCAGAFIMLFSPVNTVLYLIITGITVFLLGCNISAVYEKLAFFIEDESRAGLCIGTGYALAVLLQYVTQLQWTIPVLIAVLLVLAFASLSYLLIISPKTELSTLSQKEQGSLLQKEQGAFPQKQQKQDELVPVSRLVVLMIITFALLLLPVFYNSYIHHLQIASGYTEFNVYSWPRLLLAPGMILFGMIGDYKKGKYLPLSVLCMSLVALLNVLLAGNGSNQFNMCLYYMSLCSVIAFYHLMFLRASVKTRNPALWAPMGRILDSGIVIFSFLVNIDKLPAVWIIAIDLAAVVAVVILMSVNGYFAFRETEAPEILEKVDPFLSLQEECGLTPMEVNVLRELVQTDDKQEVIASRLNISVNTLRHHVTSIYRKTGMQTRSALCKLIQPF